MSAKYFELVSIFALFALFFFIVEYYLNRKRKKKKQLNLVSCLQINLLNHKC